MEFQVTKDNTVKTTVIYLQYLSNSKDIVLKLDIGSSELKMTFKNNALESFGAASDPHLPKIMEAFTMFTSKSIYDTQILPS